MTEQEWLECDKPEPMLKYLSKREPTNKRKPRLFCCACCRRIWHLLPDARSQTAIEVAERYADGLASYEDLCTAQQEAGRVDPTGLDHGTDAVVNTAENVEDTEWPSAFAVLEDAWFAVAESDAGYAQSGRVEVQDAAVSSQAATLRDIFGNPFRPITLDRACLTSSALSLAQAIYDERQFDRMPILADALEEGGVTNQDILNHCRQPGEHVRGCWVVDLVLGKN